MQSEQMQSSKAYEIIAGKFNKHQGSEAADEYKEVKKMLLKMKTLLMQQDNNWTRRESETLRGADK